VLSVVAISSITISSIAVTVIMVVIVLFYITVVIAHTQSSRTFILPARHPPVAVLGVVPSAWPIPIAHRWWWCPVSTSPFVTIAVPVPVFFYPYIFGLWWRRACVYWANWANGNIYLCPSRYATSNKKSCK
jgi:hypothetical protein